MAEPMMPRRYWFIFPVMAIAAIWGVNYVKFCDWQSLLLVWFIWVDLLVLCLFTARMFE